MIVSLEMPEECAHILVAMYINRDSAVAHLKIRRLEIVQVGEPQKFLDVSTSASTKQPSKFDCKNPDFRSKFRRALIAYFSESDIEDVCYDLGIAYDSIAGDAKNARIRDLLLKCEREGLFEQFVTTCLQERPNMFF